MKMLKKIQVKYKKTNENEIQLFNHPLIQYGIKETKKGLEKYINIFPKSFEHKTLDKILKIIPDYHDHIWIVRTVGLGEAQLLNFMIDELIEKWNCKTPCFISHRKIYQDLFALYNNIPFYHFNIPYHRYAYYLPNRNIKYKNKWFHIHHCTLQESINWVKKHQQGDITHATESYKNWSGVTEFKTLTPYFSEKIKEQTLLKVKNINLDLNNFVFICPESNGSKKLSNYFWEGLIDILLKNKIDVFINTATGKTTLGKTCTLTIAESAYLSSLAKNIITLRCGFAELLSAIDKRNTVHILYTKFLNSISPKNFYKTYSIKHYPFINKDVNEIILNSDLNMQTVYDEIMMSIHK